MKACTGLVLSGGRGTRMGGVNKGLLPWAGTTLAEHASNTLRTLCTHVLISANEDRPRYEKIAPTLPDHRPGHLGPLAGIETALMAMDTPWLLTLPADTPRVDRAILLALIDRLPPEGSAAYIVCGRHPHPLISLLSKSVLPAMSALLDQEERRVMSVLQAIHAHPIDLGEDQDRYFTNLNTPTDYEKLIDKTP